MSIQNKFYNFFLVCNIFSTNFENKEKEFNKNISLYNMNNTDANKYLKKYFDKINSVFEMVGVRGRSEILFIYMELHKKKQKKIICLHAAFNKSVFQIEFENTFYVLKRCISTDKSLDFGIEIIKEIDHKNVSKPIHIFFEEYKSPSNKKFYINWILLKLYEKIEEKKFHKNINEIRKFCIDVLSGLKYLHEKNIAHLDIKKDNIMYDTTEKTYKIIDFDASVITNIMPRRKYIDSYGTDLHYAPEIKLNEYFTVKSDIWSFGMTIYYLYRNKEIITRNFDINNEKTYYKLLQKNKKIYFSNNTNKDFVNFVECCTIHELNKRPNASDLLTHTFLNQK